VNINYSKTCLNRSTLGLNNLFRLDRCLVYTGPNYIYIHFVDGTVNYIWHRQVFGLLRVRFRQVFGLLRVRFRQVSLYMCTCNEVQNGHTKRHFFFSIVCTENMPSSKNKFWILKCSFWDNSLGMQKDEDRCFIKRCLFFSVEPLKRLS
jgi:hypothetical protein